MYNSMEYSPTIAGQIQRIQDATDQLRTKGIELELEVSGVDLKDEHKLDDIAKAFESIAVSKGEVKNVELAVTKFKEDGTIAGNSYILPTGFYKGLTIKPFFTQTSADEVLNIQTITGYSIEGDSGEIKPGSGFNYMDIVTYKVKHGSINAGNEGYGNNYVTAKVGTAGWLALNATQDITVPTAEIMRKVGTGVVTTISNANTLTRNFTVSPNSGSDTVLTITPGIYGSARTITVKSLKSQMTDANVTALDILDGKIAYGKDGISIRGEMPNYGGVDKEVNPPTECKNTIIASGHIIVTPKTGYYNEYSRVETGFTVGEATYEQTIEDLSAADHLVKIEPEADANGNKTIFLSQVTVDNSTIYNLLAAI